VSAFYENVAVPYAARHRLPGDVIRSLDCILFCASAALYGAAEGLVEHEAAEYAAHDSRQCEAEDQDTSDPLERGGGAMTRRNVPGTTYLLHVDPPYRHARHYLGFAESDHLADRLAQHGTSEGARLLAVAKAAGSSWRLVRTWPDSTRALERQIKNTRHVPYYCPECQPAQAQARRGARGLRRKADGESRTGEFAEAGGYGRPKPGTAHPEPDSTPEPGPPTMSATSQTATSEVAEQQPAARPAAEEGLRPSSS
jgi:hypothetical protein